MWFSGEYVAPTAYCVACGRTRVAHAPALAEKEHYKYRKVPPGTGVRHSDTHTYRMMHIPKACQLRTKAAHESLKKHQLGNYNAALAGPRAP